MIVIYDYLLLYLEGQVFGIDLLDDGLYFGLDGPVYRFPAHLNDINVLRNSLEILYFFKFLILSEIDSYKTYLKIIRKAKSLPYDNNNKIAKILHSETITTKPKHRKIDFMRTYLTPKESMSNEINNILMTY